MKLGLLTDILLKSSEKLLAPEKHRYFKKKLSDMHLVKYIKKERKREGSAISQLDKHKCIFIHIPKTGGTSIARSFIGENVGHYEWYLLKKVFGKDYDSYFKFAIVRNPWDRVVSAYHYYQSDKITDANKIWAQQSGILELDFENFIRDALENAMDYHHFKTQCSFIMDNNGKSMVDYVGRFEDLEEAAREVFSQIKINTQLEHFNKSQRKKDYRSYYNETTKSIIGRLYEEDIAAFSYSF